MHSRCPLLNIFKKTFQAAICRCSQPLSGFNSRCQEDETLIDIIMRTTPNASYVYIVDTRPKVHVCLSAFHLSEKASQTIPVALKISLLIKHVSSQIIQFQNDMHGVVVFFCKSS